VATNTDGEPRAGSVTFSARNPAASPARGDGQVESGALGTGWRSGASHGVPAPVARVAGGRTRARCRAKGESGEYRGGERGDKQWSRLAALTAAVRQQVDRRAGVTEHGVLQAGQRHRCEFPGQQAIVGLCGRYR
jgi:hypothetical protein